jgi:hypothetical protein
MTREVKQEDKAGRPVVVVYRRSDADRAAARTERAEQADRALEVAASLRQTDGAATR